MIQSLESFIHSDVINPSKALLPWIFTGAQVLVLLAAATNYIFLL